MKKLKQQKITNLVNYQPFLKNNYLIDYFAKKINLKFYSEV